MRPRTPRSAWFLVLLVACATGCRTSAREVAAVPTLAGPARRVPLRTSDFDVEHYALELALDPAARTIDGVCRVRLHARETLRTVGLDLAGLEVRSIRDERENALAFRRAGDALSIDLARPLAPGDFVELVIAYGGRPAKGLWFAAERDGVATQVFTHGECDEARFWFPCWDHPSDRATSELSVTMPARWKAVAAGERIERVEHGELATELWRISFPHPTYLATLVAGEFEERGEDCDGIPLVYLAEPRYADWLAGSFAETCAMLRFFTEVTGTRYPYAKYSQACLANFPFGGMENISASTLTEHTLADERGRRDATSTGLVAHEAAHQWFGNLLTCNDWPHIWLNEGFATYLAALYTEKSRGVDEFRVQMRDAQDAYVAKDVAENRRPFVDDVYRDPFDLFFSGHAYQGGAARLHLLRFLLGDAAFFRGVRLYVGRNAGRGVVTDDLRSALEEASGVDLERVFAQWFEGRGYPEIEVSWRHDVKRGQVLLDVAQVQDVGDGTPGVFELPFEVSIRDASGVRTERLLLDKRRHLYAIAQPEEPTAVRFDPNGWIPKKLDERKRITEWLVIAAVDEDAPARREAVQVLGRALAKATGDVEREKLAEALLARLGADESAAVRAAAASAVAAAAAVPVVRDALLAAGSGDLEAKVRVAALDALRPAAPDAELARVGERESAAGFSWATMAAAEVLRARAAPEHAFERLTEKLGVGSPHGLFEARLVPEIARLEDARVLPLLRDLAGDGARGETLRVAAISALATRGRGNPATTALLIELLDCPVWRVRREAIAALGVMRDPLGLREIERYHAESVFPTERRAIEAALEAEARRGS